MRALVLIPGPLGERLSAPEVRGWNVALELARRHEVTVSAPDPAAPVRDGIPIISAERRQIVAAARNADVVIAPWVPPYLYAALAGASTLFVADMYNPAELELAEMRRGLEARLLLASMRGNDRLQLRFADVVLCAVEAQRRRLGAEIERLTRDSARPLLRVVPFGVDNDPPRPAARRPMRERFPSIGDDDTIVLWWGNVWRWFDAETALRAFAEVARARPHVKLVFTGGRPPRHEADPLDETESARKLAGSLGLLGESVHFVGDWVPHAERHEYLQEADVGLTLHRDTPEKQVAARGRYMDYLWSRLPCVLGAGDELADAFAGAGFAATVATGDVDGAAATIGRLVDDADARERARAAAEPLLARFRWSAAVKPLLDALDEVGGRAPLRARGRAELAMRLGGFYLRRAAHQAAATVTAGRAREP